MNEQAWFRLTLVVALLVALGTWGAWGWHLREAADVESYRESRQTYQRTMEKQCRASPTFPGCISDEEYVLGQLQGMQEAAGYRQQARTLFPWALGSPIAILLLFFVVRWITTGRLRPLWVLDQRQASDQAVSRN
jgi:hypothetical protein